MSPDTAGQQQQNVGESRTAHFQDAAAITHAPQTRPSVPTTARPLQAPGGILGQDSPAPEVNSGGDPR